LSGHASAPKAFESRSNLRLEPARADDAYRSLTPELAIARFSDTIATAARFPLPRPFAILRKNVDRILLVSEEEIISAARLVWERMKLSSAFQRRRHGPRS